MQFGKQSGGGICKLEKMPELKSRLIDDNVQTVRLFPLNKSIRTEQPMPWISEKTSI